MTPYALLFTLAAIGVRHYCNYCSGHWTFGGGACFGYKRVAGQISI